MHDTKSRADELLATLDWTCNVHEKDRLPLSDLLEEEGRVEEALLLRDEGAWHWFENGQICDVRKAATGAMLENMAELREILSRVNNWVEEGCRLDEWDCVNCLVEAYIHGAGMDVGPNGVTIVAIRLDDGIIWWEINEWWQTVPFEVLGFQGSRTLSEKARSQFQEWTRTGEGKEFMDEQTGKIKLIDLMSPSGDSRNPHAR